MASLIKQLHRWSLSIAAVFVLFNVAIVAGNVILRYGFDIGIVALQELEWWTYSLIFLIGATATLIENRHVRIDVLAHRFSPPLRQRIEQYGTLLLLIPFLLALLIPALRFAIDSAMLNERSSDPGGMPAVYLIKAAIPLGLLLLFVASVIILIRGRTTEQSTR